MEEIIRSLFEGDQKGVNLGGWISQCVSYEQKHFETFITEQDIEQIASWGLDHVRVPVEYYILEEEELAEIFSLVNNYLFPGGLFIFDFNTVYKYREIIGESTIAENREDCSFIWENFYDPEGDINEYDLTVFVRKEGDIFRKFTETHLQRGYTAEQMTRLVEQAGMEVVEVLDADTGEAVTDTSERVYVVAREKAKKE